MRDRIKRAADCKRIRVEVPEWDGVLAMRELNGLERSDFERKIKGVEESGPLALALLLIACCEDDEGKPLFQPGDESWLVTKSALVLMRVGKEAMRLNGLGDEAQQEQAKNSPPAS